MHLLPDTVARFLVRPFNQTEDHGFIVSCKYRLSKVGQLTLRDVVAPTFENPKRALFNEVTVGLGRVFDERLFAVGTAIRKPSI